MQAMTKATSASISVNNVSKEFVTETGSLLNVLNGINLTIAGSSFVSLLGPSGCGKTTLMRVVAGLETTTSGTVEVDGEQVESPPAGLGMVFQEAALMPWRGCLDNVLYPLETLHRVNSQTRQHARDLLRLVGLEGFEKAKPYQLSGGMRQRVNLARALVHSPRLLLMDEPFGALDELTRLSMHELLQRLRHETAATVLFVTHSISEAVFLSDRVVVMSRRPSRVADDFEVPFPHPRGLDLRHTPEFNALEARAEAALGHLEDVSG